MDFLESGSLQCEFASEGEEPVDFEADCYYDVFHEQDFLRHL
jgi:hypothetical protein